MGSVLTCIKNCEGRTVGFSLPRTGLGFRFFSISSRTFKLLEFSNLSKIVVEGRERKEKRICGMCEHVYTFHVQIIGSHYA